MITPAAIVLNFDFFGFFLTCIRHYFPRSGGLLNRSWRCAREFHPSEDLRAAPIAWKLWLDRSTCVNAVMACGLPKPLLNGLTRSSPYGRRLMRFPAQVSYGASFVSLVHSLMLLQ